MGYFWVVDYSQPNGDTDVCKIPPLCDALKPVPHTVLLCYIWSTVGQKLAMDEWNRWELMNCTAPDGLQSVIAHLLSGIKK